MYEYIKGIFKGINKDYVIIENNKIGYKIFTSGSTIAKMPNIDEEVVLYVYQIVREDFIGLYGFLTKEELLMFNTLLTINGVGAKASLSLLSISSVTNLKYAILSGDYKTLMRAPGVGKKTSQRIILELKDKIKMDESIKNNLDENGVIEDFHNENNLDEALEALISLGFTEKEAKKALKEQDNTNSIEDIIKNSLKHLMN